MKQKYTVDVSGIQLTIVTEEEEAYVKELARTVDEKIHKIIMSNTRRTKTEAIIFTAIDYLDERNKIELDMDKLRNQINGYKRDVEDLKRENDELKKLLDA